MRFENVRAIVTGAAAGIGKATAIQLANEGAHVGVLDINAEGAETVASETGGTSTVVDISDLESIAPSVNALASELGQIGLLVNCA
jgi:NAD(P)-dependent dehydrogenase (short-subunit alcohol dehydrogenase family)